MTSVAIQGISGSFHEQAAIEFFGENISISPSSSFEQLVAKASSADVDYGIIAIENTVAGTIHRNLQLIRNSKVSIVGEIHLRIEQNLIGRKGTNIDQLTEVRSHYMAINQCKDYLDFYPQLARITTTDTASAVKWVAENESNSCAAIGSGFAAKKYGLEILKAGIETNKQNYTRFLVISKKHQSDSEFEKSTVIIKLPHEKGALASLLKQIDQLGVNLSKIESFPVIGEPWHYEFVMDFESPNNESYRHLKMLLNSVAKSYSILGVYKPFLA